MAKAISHVFLSDSKEFRDPAILFNIGVDQHKQNLTK